MSNKIGNSRLVRYGALALATLIILPAMAAAENWPQFRGPGASGIAEGAPPTTFDAEKGSNIRWRTAIPGLGHSSPVVWGERVFVTTAVGEGHDDVYLRVGLYGESPDNTEDWIHHFRVYCLDKNTGKIIWERTAYSGKPQVKRHIKSSHATASVAVDGKHIVAMFGSEGMYCYDMDGKLLWKKDLGLLDAGAFNSPDIQWGFGSSPIIFDDLVIMLCDVNNQSFLATFAVESGKEVWRTLRDEGPTWGTPTVHEGAGKAQIIVNGYKHIGGYDLKTGGELWRMSGGGDVPVPTPVLAHGLVFITNAHGRMYPIYAIRLNATGDISLADGETANQYIAWSLPRRGAYMPTPIVIGDNLYIGNNRGILTCYDAKTGEQKYRERIGGVRGAYSASPVAADGKIYFSDEKGLIHVIKAGDEYQHLATNRMGDVLMASPAISGDMLFVRTAKDLFGIGVSAKTLSMADRKGATAEGFVAPEKPPAAAKPAALPTDGSELDDPVEILRHADAAARAISTVSYDLSLEPAAAAKAMLGSIKVSITASGYLAGNPEKSFVDGEFVPPGATEAIKFTAGNDGNRYYLFDHSTKTVHRDFESGVLGSASRPLRYAMIGEFHAPAPFSDEINASSHELRESKNFDGHDCYAVYLFFKEYEVGILWYFSKQDFLPRARESFFKVEGKDGSFLRTITNLVVEPKLPDDAFALKVPAGYKVTDQPAS